MGSNLQFMSRMECNQRTTGRIIPHQTSPPVMTEDVGNESFPEQGIVEASLLFDRQVRPIGHQHPGKGPYPISHRHPSTAVDPDPFHATTWRAFFENKTVEFKFVQFFDLGLGVLLHGIGQISAAGRFDQSGIGFTTFQSYGGARNAEVDFQLRAHGDPG